MKARKTTCPFCFSSVLVAAPTNGSFPEQYCDNCGSRIPEESLYSELLPIAVVGPSRSGKTHFLTVMAHQLLEDVVWPSYWVASRVVRVRRPDDGTGSQRPFATSDDDFLNFEESLYPQLGAGEILQQTERRDETRLPLSLVVHLSFEKPSSSFGSEPYGRKSVMLAFTDTAGEDLARTGWGDIVKKYPVFEKGRAKALIALVDPAELTGLRDDMSANPILAQEFGKVGIELKVQATMASVLSIPQIRKMRRTPLAVCLTKTDALAHLGQFADDDPISCQSDALSGERGIVGRINLSAIGETSDSVKRFLAMKDKDGDDKIARAASNFRYHSFFAIDALGSAIRSVETVDGHRLIRGTPSPRGVLDPLLWILWQHGYIGGRAR